MRRPTSSAHRFANVQPIQHMVALLTNQTEGSPRGIHLFGKQINPSQFRQTIQRLFMFTFGSLIIALAYSLFQIPYNLASGGVSGMGIILGHVTGLPVGVWIFLMNVPLLILGYKHLGQWRFLGATIFSVIVISVMTDVFTLYLPKILSPYPLTDDMLLSSIYAGLVSGIGMGLLYRFGGSPGGTGILGLIVQRKTGMPLSQIYLYTDGIVIVVAGVIFGWESALHATLILFLCGMASDFALEGPSMVRTATIVTTNSDELTKALMVGLNRGVSHWQVFGGYTGMPHTMILCTVLRSQVNDLKQIVADVDTNAFVVIGNAHQALGSGFLKLKKR